jgi:hypothetical protein
MCGLTRFPVGEFLNGIGIASMTTDHHHLNRGSGATIHSEQIPALSIVLKPMFAIASKTTSAIP